MEKNKEIFISKDKGISELPFMKAMKEAHNKTPEEIIFREAPLGEQTDVDRKHATIECIEASKMRKIRKNLKDLAKAPKQPLEQVEVIKDDIVVKSKKKIRKDTSMSALWNKEVKRKELKKEIQGQIENLQDHHLKISKEKLNPYLEYNFNKNSQDLLGFGDWHFGARTCDVRKIKETIKKIKNKGTAVILMGDLIENSNRYSVGAGVYEQVMTPMKQMDGVCELLEPIKNQCLVSIMGNHEFRTLKEVGYDPTRIICDRLNIPYAGFESFIRMKIKDFNYIIYATHGSTAARFFWTRVKALEDVMRHVDADVVLYAHTHSKMYHEIRYKGIREKKKIGVLTGAFLKDDPFGYATMKNLPPVKTGLIPLKLCGTHWDIHGKD